MKAVKALLHRLIDYAGLFPPASLPLKPAIENYLSYRQSDDSWMLSRFIIPATRLGELRPFYGQFEAHNPCMFSLLGRGGETPEEFLANLKADLESIGAFLRETDGTTMADFFEVRLPQRLLEKPRSPEISSFLDQAAALIQKKAVRPLKIFYEITAMPNWAAALTELFRGFAEHRTGASNAVETGIKLRTGGVESAAFPPVEKVAAVIDHAIHFAVPFKATAGLHHPVRHYNGSVRTKMHGFINVFGGAVLAAHHHFSAELLGKVIAEENPANFYFEENRFGWKEWEISAEKIAGYRRELFISYGSCSFDEPREDLRGMGWLK